MLAVLSLFFIGAVCAPSIMARGRAGFAILALIPALTFGWFTFQLVRAFDGEVYVSTINWLPQVGLNLDFRIDALSAVMALLVTGVGALVLAYSSRYFSPTAQHLGRFAGVFMAFAGAMLGLVVADNTLLMYTFWELTTVFSFLLIGHYSSKGTSRRAARQAIIVTTAGGLAMLVGIIMLGEMRGGSYLLSELVTAAQVDHLGYGQETLLATAVILVLIGAFSKSALFPFHFWLPSAMAAPTPVSAYLHAAAMVKAGVYLVARIAPGFSHLTQWRWMITIAGISTLLIGGYRALKQNDLKLVLAFGTVSQLGLIILMVGYGTAPMALAGLMLLCAHALFKSALFLTVGIIDASFGTRDLRELSGVGRTMPVIATFAALATASMIGFVPFGSFVAKEHALAALIGGGPWATVTWIAIACGSVLTVAYGLRFWWGAFMLKPGVKQIKQYRGSLFTGIPVGILALTSVVLGIASPAWSPILEMHADNYPGATGHLALWHGFGAPLLVTIAVFGLGFTIFALRSPFERFAKKHSFPLRADMVFNDSLRQLDRLSGFVTGLTQRGSLPAYLFTIFIVTLASLAVAIVVDGVPLPNLRPWDSPMQAGTVLITVIAAVMAARSRHRMKAVLLMGVTGYGVAIIYELYGAPDLALTQVLSETVTLVIFVLVLRRLPPYFSNRPLRGARTSRIAVAVLVGAAFSGLAAIAAGVRVHEPISKLFPEEAFHFGYGSNIVNVTLVDIRAWDTIGETSVLVVCAIGIASLVFVRDTQARTDRLRNIIGPMDSALRERIATVLDAHKAPDLKKVQEKALELPEKTGPSWLSTMVRHGVDSVPVILAFGTRLVFPSIFAVSLFFLFSGHNAPGGGFAGGLLAGIALALRYLAGGRFELGAALPVLPAHLMGGGLIIAAVTVIFPVFYGGLPMQTVMFDFSLPWFGSVHFATALVFDVGIYLAVLGLSLEILRSLGGEIDRHGEIEGLDKQDPYELVPSDDERREARDEREMQEMIDAWEERE